MQYFRFFSPEKLTFNYSIFLIYKPAIGPKNKTSCIKVGI